MLSKLESSDFYPAITLVFWAAIGLRAYSDRVYDDLYSILLLLIPFVLLVFMAFLCLAKAGEVLFCETDNERQARLKSTPARRNLGHAMTLVSYFLFYALLFNWSDITEYFVDNPRPIQYQWGQEAKALGLVVWEFHEMMEQSLADFEHVEYTPEQLEFWQSAFEEYPVGFDTGDVMGKGILPPGRGFFLIVVLALGVCGGLLRKPSKSKN